MKYHNHPQTKWLLCVAILAAGLSQSPGAYAGGDSAVHKEERMLIYNEDFVNWFIQKPEMMREVALQAYIDQLAGGAVTHFFMNPNGQRTTYRSAVREAIWDEVGGKAPDSDEAREMEQTVSNAKLLHDKGIDPYAVWIKRCREKRISPWISMRMNDMHRVTIPNSPWITNFWRKHPELRRNPNYTGKDWGEYTFDYSKMEVRSFELALVRELLERYDCDGFETDWMRFPLHFTKPLEQGHFLTQFMRDVRSIAKEWEIKRGHPIRISARIPTDPDVAAALGMDAALWAKEGLVDMIVASCYWHTIDFDTPIERWQERFGNVARKVPVVPGGVEGISAYKAAPRQMITDPALYYGWAASSRYRGAGSFYLFNFMMYWSAALQGDSSLLPNIYRPMIEKGLSDEVVLGSRRRHPVTFHDTRSSVPDGAQLPKMTAKSASFTIHIGKKPASGKVAVIAGLSEKDGVKDATFTASLNGQKAFVCSGVLTPEQYGGKSTVRAVRFEMSLKSARDGANIVEIVQDAGAHQQIVWMEIEIDPMK